MTMRYLLTFLSLCLSLSLFGQNFDLELRDISISDTADTNFEVQIQGKIVNIGPNTCFFDPAEALMRFSLPDSAPDTVVYSNLVVDAEDYQSIAPASLDSGDSISYSYRLSLSGKGGGKGVTVVIWPTRAASLLDQNPANGYQIVKTHTGNGNAYGIGNGNAYGIGNGNGNGNGKKKNQREGAPVPLLVYPNPAGKGLQIQLPEAGGEIQISDPRGRIVYLQSGTEETLTLRVPDLHLSPGIYFIQWKKGNWVEQKKVWITSQ